MIKYRLLAGTAIVAAAALGSSQAFAFDELNWSWDLDVDTDITQQFTFAADLEPSGLVVVEDWQIHIGDVTATSLVTDVTNNQPAGEGGTVAVPLTLTLTGEASATGDTTLEALADAQVTDSEDNVLADVSDTINNSGIDPAGDFTGTADFIVEVEIPGEAMAFDATVELPEVVSAAVAVGNNANITSAVKTDVHDTQILFNADEDEPLGSFTVTEEKTTTSQSEMDSSSESWDLAKTASLGGSFNWDYAANESASETSSATWNSSHDLNADFAKTASLDAEGTADFEGTFDADLEKNLKFASLTANATGEFDGTADFEATADLTAEGTLSASETASSTSENAANFESTTAASLALEGSKTWAFNQASEAASSNSFETETMTHSMSVETDGDLYALYAAGSLWGHLLHEGVNTGLATTLTLMTAAALGGLEQAEISADSQVYNILNASVDSSAAAIGNNKSITVDAATPDDAALLADVNQFAYANITANSQVGGVTVDNYIKLGQIDRALVNSSATAIGNNLNVSVSSPLSPNGDE
ncbi:hypothetical protein [Algihabitans albus]|uniref:hypothetical protein n=1 Tax=Algihabitans albus TaxID=2164067 RepID=UPI000E5D4C4A|nr:hypothetical protein [Algihabitans albus]